MLTSLDLHDHAKCQVFHCAFCARYFTPGETHWYHEPNCPKCRIRLPNSLEHIAECENWQVENEALGEAIYNCQEAWFETHECDEPTTDETDSIIESILANMGLSAIHFADGTVRHPAMPASVLRQAVEEAMDSWWNALKKAAL